MADEMRAYEPTMRERMADALQSGMEGIGVDRYKARKHAQTIMGGPSSNLPMNMGAADFVPFVGTGLQTEEAVDSLKNAKEAAGRGDMIDAGVEGAFGVAGLIPGAAGTVKAGKALVKKIKAMDLPKLKPIGTDSVPKKQSLREWAMAGGGVPMSHKDKPDVWHDKARKMAAGGEVYNTTPDMSDGGEIIDGPAFAGGGGVKKLMKEAITSAAEKAGMKAPTVAAKDLTTLQDFHTSLGDKVRERATKAQEMMDSWNYKYGPGQHVFTEHGAANNLPPLRILERSRSGNQVMREDHPTLGPGLGKPMKDPNTGETMRTPYEPGYRVRRQHSADPNDYAEFIIPESAIKGDVEMAKGGGAKKVVKDVVEEGVEAIKKFFGGADEAKEAGRIAFERQTPERLAREAEAAKKLAAMPPRSKAAVTEMGLYHPVGGGLKLSKPTWAMHATTVPDPQFKQPNIPIITPEQLVKEEAALFPLVGDRAAAGSYLTHVGANELERPVRLTGGPRYMDANYNPMNPEQSAAWESGLGRVTALGRQAMRAGEGGRPVYGIYTAGSGTNTDFNVMGANALLQQIPHSKISKKAEREFDRAMREGTKTAPPIPNWPGIRSPEAEAMILDKSNGIVRTKLFDTMGKENFQSMGFPDVPATRKAIIEPELLDVPTNQAGYRLARMDPTGRIIESPNIPSDYPTAMAGQVAGKLDVPADYKDVFQSHFDARRLLGQPESGDYYSFSRAHPIQYANEEWLNRLMEQRFANERKIKEGSYKKGGKVKEEGGALAKVKKQPKQQAQQHPTAKTNAPKQKLKGGLTLAKN